MSRGGFLSKVRLWLASVARELGQILDKKYPIRWNWNKYNAKRLGQKMDKFYRWETQYFYVFTNVKEGLTFLFQERPQKVAGMLSK